MLNTTRPSKHSGLSLVELMIAITVGLVIVTGVLSLFLSAVRSNSDNLKATRLNQDLRTAMAVMVRDIRRAGAWGGAAANVANSTLLSNPFTNTVNTTDLTVNGSCITYTYDAPPADGLINNNEYYGFKLNTGAVQMRTGDSTTSSAAHGCSDGSWQSLTDGGTITINTLTFALAETSIPLGGGGNRIIRAVTITLAGSLNSDAGVSRTLIENVRIPNDRYN